MVLRYNKNAWQHQGTLKARYVFARMTKGRLNEEVLHTVDGSECRRSPVDVVDIPLFTGLDGTIQVVGLGMSEPSTSYVSPLWAILGSLNCKRLKPPR